ncbi:hypothetical protein ACILDV_08420 [Capnocytophaga canimorsus]|uniref:hypothetical protein n=1 Tax=Capnocytophaga canimorsus TaxID=28188 RepID=UPI0037D51049
MSLLIRNRKPIRLRPEIVLTNEEFGRFEVDLIVGTEHPTNLYDNISLRVLILKKLAKEK